MSGTLTGKSANTDVISGELLQLAGIPGDLTVNTSPAVTGVVVKRSRSLLEVFLACRLVPFDIAGESEQILVGSDISRTDPPKLMASVEL